MAWNELKADDGHAFQAWVAQPQGRARGGVVVLQEIFGVNRHIRSVCDRLAAQGWLAVAPALFDRAERDAAFGYGGEEMAQARAVRARVQDEDSLRDVQAAIEFAQRAGKVAVMGFCWGGTLAWLAAARLPGLSAAVAYYGTQIGLHVQDRPRVPVLLHFGDRDTHIPPEHVERIARAWPDVPLFRYDAAHGFNCDERGSFEPASARIAGARTQDFFEEHLTC